MTLYGIICTDNCWFTMTSNFELENLTTQDFDPEREDFTRRRFLKAAGISFAAFAAANYLLSDLSLAEANANTTPESQQQTVTEASSDMQVGINIPDPNAQDIALINSGEFDFSVQWAPSMSQIMPRKDSFVTTSLDISKASFDQTKNSGKVYVALPSQLPDWCLNSKLAPENFDLNSHEANYLRTIFARYILADYLIPDNEPDLAFDYEHYNEQAVAKAAKKMIMADHIAQEVGYKGVLLGPASSDTIGKYGANFFEDYVNYINFLGYQFKTETAISVHSYAGIKHNNPSGILAINGTAKTSYPSDNKSVHITESGNTFETVETSVEYVYRYANYPPLKIQEMRQAKHMIDMYKNFRAIGISAVANYTFYDSQDGGGGWMCGYYSYTGKPHLIYKKRNELK
jgi:hypothetical protein